MTGRIPCSVPILTLNARSHLERVLPVLCNTCDDVFIVDGNSTDGTVEYAQSLGVRVERQFDHDTPNSRIQDFTAARLRSWSFARHPWIFLVDADEVPTPELRRRVQHIVSEGTISAVHRFRRLIRLPNGRIVTRAFSYPEETMVRLFHRHSGISLVPHRKVHERFQIPETIVVEQHAEALIHDWPSLDVFQKKLAQYAVLEYRDAAGGPIHRLRWVIWYNLRSALGQLLRAVWVWIAGTLRGQTVLPWAYTWPMIAYRFRAMARGLRQNTPQL